MKSAMADALYLVDGYNLLFRAYHALPPLSTSKGVPSGAVYGFATMLIKLEVSERPSHLAVVYDGGGRSLRAEAFADYKANRVEPPDDLKPQFAGSRRMVEAFGIPLLESRDCEADDLIAALVIRARAAGLRSVIVSSDKDLMQLVDSNCVLMDTMKDPPKVYDAAAVEEKFGVGPAQLGDVLALMGDSVDNVPGIPGIGPKTASSLIKHFGSLEQMIARAGEIASTPGLRGAASIAEKVKAHAEQARLSRKLVELDTSVPVPVELDALKRHEPDMARVETLLREYEFNRLIDRLKPLQAATASVNLNVNVNAVRAPTEIGKQATRIITSSAELDALVTDLSKATAFGLALESTGGPPSTAALIGIALAGEGAPAYVPVGHRYLGAPVQLSLDDALKKLAPLFSSATPRKHVFDSKDAEILLARHGVALAGIDTDPRIASYVLDPTVDNDLSALSAIESREALCGKGKKATPYESLEIARAAKFAGCEAEATLALGTQLGARIREKPEVRRLFDEIEMPLSHVLAVIERHGVCLDVAMLRAISADVEKKLHAIEDEVRKTTGSDINLGSPKQLQELLFDKLQLTPTKKTKTGFSVDAEVLEELAPLHPIAAQILEHRTLAKLKGTYLDALPLLIDSRSGRLHTRYMQTIAATGRLSSVEPNLQNVPIRTEQGKEIRRAFCADKAASWWSPITRRSSCACSRTCRRIRCSPTRSAAIRTSTAAPSRKCSAPPRPTIRSCARWPR
jgi:DNA polymerase-1